MFTLPTLLQVCDPVMPSNGFLALGPQLTELRLTLPRDEVIPAHHLSWLPQVRLHGGTDRWRGGGGQAGARALSLGEGLQLTSPRDDAIPAHHLLWLPWVRVQSWEGTVVGGQAQGAEALLKRCCLRCQGAG